MTTNSKEGVSMTTKTGKHTPGPWQIALYGDNERPVIVRGEERIARDMSEANAHLIASAPELLEALCVAREWMGSIQTNGLQQAQKLVDKAIAKAEGGV